MFEFGALKAIKITENKAFSEWIEKNKSLILIIYQHALTPLGPVCLLPSAITNGDGTAGKIWAKLCALSHGHNSDTKTKKIFHFTSIVWYFTVLHVRRHGTDERKTVGLRESH